MSLPEKYNPNIEILRGYAALIVVLDHVIIWSNDLNPGFNFRAEIFPYGFPGRLMVLIFFMLSGYVIGLTNNKNDTFNWRKYVRKRLIRLWPIYTIAIMITVIFFLPISIKILLGNLFFLQNIVVTCFAKNSPLWSLNHEIVYYALAIPLLLKKISLRTYGVAILLLLLFTCFIYPFPLLLEGYLVGLLFWLTGFWLSKLTNENEPDQTKFLSVFLLCLGCSFLNTASVMIGKLPILHGEQGLLTVVINMYDFGLYPACLYALIVFSGRFKKYSIWLFYLVVFLSISHLIILIKSGSFFQTSYFYCLPYLSC